MLIVHRDLKPFLILSVALTASCLSMPEPEPELDATAQAVEAPPTLQAEEDADLKVLELQDGYYDPETGITTGGHCNVRLVQCDPYPIGRGHHPHADAGCSQVCLDTIAHCEDYSTAEIEFCCTHPGQAYRDSSGRVFSNKVCQISGEPNWFTRCAPGLNP